MFDAEDEAVVVAFRRRPVSAATFLNRIEAGGMARLKVGTVRHGLWLRTASRSKAPSGP